MNGEEESEELQQIILANGSVSIEDRFALYHAYKLMFYRKSNNESRVVIKADFLLINLSLESSKTTTNLDTFIAPACLLNSTT